MLQCTYISSAPYGCKMSAYEYLFLKTVKIYIIFKNKQTWACWCCQLHVVGTHIHTSKWV